jgi:CRISPR-associated endonuclease/helicase Cas3
MYLSHNNPEKKLTTHLSEVYDYSTDMLKSMFLSEDDYTMLLRINKIVALTHDFGKYLSYFQTYLKEGKEQGNLHHHSFISAVFAAHLLSKLPSEKAAWSELGPLLGYFVTMHHHGNLRDVSLDVMRMLDIEDDTIPSTLLHRFPILEKQIQDIEQHIHNIITDLAPLWNQLNLSLSLQEELYDFVSHYQNTFDVVYRQYKTLNKWKKKKRKEVDSIFFYTLLLYSVLIDADKKSAANIEMKPRVHIPHDLVDQYRQSNFDVHVVEGTNGWRNRMYNTVMKQMQEISQTTPDHQLFTLTAPTGAGKTLLSLSVALKWRQQIEKRHGYIPKIIYALPFTSVIDQNEKVIRRLLAQLPDFLQNEQRYLVKHHHLSTFQYKSDDEEVPLRKALLLTESWESEIIITTFVQLFYTLIGYENRSLKKFHQIAGSIIILDEIQNMPIEYWPLLRFVFENMAKLFSCRFLLLTATQPLIFGDGEAVELLDSDTVKAVDYFKEMERVNLQWLGGDEGSYNVEEWIELFKKRFEDGKNYLAIFNTISTSIEIYDGLKEWLKDQGYDVLYLSTNIIPLKRQERINQIKELLEKKVVVISTQVVEAGVDVDFDVIYRDLGPIDSIIQAAGRCNRNGKLQKKTGELGQVFITPIQRRGRLESQLVYGALHTTIAKDVLPKTAVSEHQFFDIIDSYFMNVQDKKNFGASAGIVAAMQQLKFDSHDNTRNKNNPEYVSEFCLIEDSHQAVDVFVAVDDEAVEVWERYIEQVVKERDYEVRFENYLRMKKQVRQYVISAPIKLVKNLDRDLYDRTRMIYLSNDILDQYYNSEYGLIRKSEMVDAWTL